MTEPKKSKKPMSEKEKLARKDGRQRWYHKEDKPPVEKNKSHGHVKLWPTYEEAKMLMSSRGIRSRKHYYEWHKEHRVAFVPYAPHQVYKRLDEWVGWNDYLGTNNTWHIHDTTEYLPFYEAARWVHTLKLKTVKEWLTYANANELPTGICKWPEYVYRDMWGHNKGGVAYTEWLGLDASSKVTIAQEVERVWALVHIANMPTNVFTVVKDVKTTVVKAHGSKYNVLALYEFEQDLEFQMVNVLDSMTTIYGDADVHRLCANFYTVLAQLDRFLLKTTFS